MFAPWTGLSSSASLGLTRWHLSPIFPRCPCLRTTSVYLLGWQWHDTFSILTLVQVSQLHDLYHIDESPWKLGRAEGVGFSSPQRFNVAFRKQKGMTPMEYRHKYTK